MWKVEQFCCTCNILLAATFYQLTTGSVMLSSVIPSLLPSPFICDESWGALIGMQPSWCAGQVQHMWQALNSPPFLGEELFPSLISTFLAAGLVVQQNYKSLKWSKTFLDILWSWSSCQSTECWSHLFVFFQVSHTVFLLLPLLCYIQ